MIFQVDKKYFSIIAGSITNLTVYKYTLDKTLLINIPLRDPVMKLKYLRQDKKRQVYCNKGYIHAKKGLQKSYK